MTALRPRANDEPARVRCPHCGSQKNRVLRVRCRRSDFAVVRRHRCHDCHVRFSSTQQVNGESGPMGA